MVWDNLRAHHAATADRRFETLLDPARADDFSATAGDMVLDYAKTNIDAAARDLLIALLDQTGVAAKREAMFTGAAINETEGRAVLHTALRNLDGGPVMVDGADVMPDVLATLARMADFAAAVRDGTIRGRAGRSPMSSISASAGPTLGRRWPCVPWRPITTARVAISSAMWTLPISRLCCASVIPRRRW